MARNNPLRLSLDHVGRSGPWLRLWRWVTAEEAPPGDVCNCTIEPAGRFVPVATKDWGNPWTGVPGLVQGDLHLPTLALGFDETAAAQRTLEFHDPALACICPQECNQHPWRRPA